MTEFERILIVAICFVIFLFCFYWRRNNKNKKPKANILGTSIKHDTNTQDMLQYHEKENDILLKIAQADRELNAKLDTKIALLKVLIEKAEKLSDELKDHTGSQATAKNNTPPISKELPKQEQIHQRVKQLNDAGLSPSEIASHMKMMEGEVNLILSLLRKKLDG